MSRILLCGLNGAGKSTLGKALAQKIGYTWLDIEDYYFPKKDPANPYAHPRTQDEVAVLLLRDLQENPNVILSTVRANYSAEILTLLEFAFYISVPKEIRMERIRNRSFQKFGSRVLPGGDLYQQEQSFFQMALRREDTHVTNWLSTLSIPVYTLDGRRSLEDLLEEACKTIETGNAGA